MFTEDAVFRNSKASVAAVGHDQIAAFAEKMYKLCVTLRRNVTTVYSVDDDTFFTEGYMIYTVAGGKQLDPIPIASVFRLQPGTSLIKEYTTYMDPTMLLLHNGYDITIDSNDNMVLATRNTSCLETI